MHIIMILLMVGQPIYRIWISFGDAYYASAFCLDARESGI